MLRWRARANRLAHSLSPWGWALLGIVLVGVAMRAVLIGYGLPLLLYEDEPIYYQFALGFGLGEWVIPYFKKPPFFLYAYGTLYYLAFLFSPILHWKDYVDAFWRDPTYVATVGRSFSVLLAGGSIALLGLIGRKAFSPAVGLLAALMLAIDPTLLRVAPIVISDIPSLFCILLSAWCALKIIERGSLRDYLLCAATVTLAVSFKYNVFTAAFLLAAHLVRHAALHRFNTRDFWQNTWTDKRFWLAVGLMPLLFLVLNPMIILNSHWFFNQIAYERNHMLQRDPYSTTESWRFMAAAENIFNRILPRAMGWPLYVTSFVAVAWVLWRYRRQGLVLLSFPCVFLLVLLQFQLINAKYLMPLLPFLYLGAAVLLRDAYSWLRGRFSPAGKALPIAVAAIALVSLLAWPVSLSWQYVAVQLRTDTRQDANRTLRSLVRPEDRLLLEPDTITLDNQIIRPVLVLSKFDGQGFQTETPVFSYLNTVDPLKAGFRFVLMDFSEMERIRDAQGRRTYKVPHPENPGYYETLRSQYRLREIFSPYRIFMRRSRMETMLREQGFETLYDQIQRHKTARRRPGPLLLLLERKEN